MTIYLILNHTTRNLSIGLTSNLSNTLRMFRFKHKADQMELLSRLPGNEYRLEMIQREFEHLRTEKKFKFYKYDPIVLEYFQDQQGVDWTAEKDYKNYPNPLSSAIIKKDDIKELLEVNKMDKSGIDVHQLFPAI